MITSLLIIYAFMAGMTAEYTHTRLEKISSPRNFYLTAFLCGICWPYVIWRAK